MSKKNAEKTAGKVASDVDKAVEVKAPKVEIIRGRMPLAVVAMIKFGETELTDGACAAKFRTTNGKVSDIRKNANFGYINEDYVPSESDIAKAVEYADQLEDSSVSETLKAMTPATKEQTEAFDTARKATRKTTAKKVEPAGDVSKDELDGLTE